MDETTPTRRRGEWPRVLPVLKSADEMEAGTATFQAMTHELQRQGYDVGRIAVLVKAGLASLVLTTAGIPLDRGRTGIVNAALNEAIDRVIGEMRLSLTESEPKPSA